MGTLYIVATPIGNLKDITLRAIGALKEVDFILCEDSRQTIKLLQKYEISKPLISYFQHSKVAKTDYILEQLEKGKKLALVTDAGTPGISDPGNQLVKLVVSRLPDVQIIPLPGPSALLAALSVSGFPTDKFIFMGFPPAKKGREKFFKKVLDVEYTVVLYESPHRILKSLGQLNNLLKAKSSKLKANVVVCRELTKKFETIYRGSVNEIIEQLNKGKNNLKGEFAIVVWNP
ncbi:16S rRNA (cytidine(1402)-2'-O)-methyltransferase [Candidatus Wolfebacteria bacterium CG_4_10_14_0_2_um_filter_39_18]|uniref:Ribosomal RNA small subunit methyltransferase I n=1 Tax=Candidatus Wolfebacteria bacterium CG_4_10_14_0_2_um_filter_39_18 TaxID=1975061 RepID=A0A2M7TF11_9BACT|nr:MAG: 16S rRNA (cytidine(1402)-2'-O)-methyltransferase [Candidatus Wolfebacteria bacterium CG_4_10_14_0_2_um_filter_39_18]